MSTSNTVPQRNSCRSNKYKMCHANRSGNFQIDKNEMIECQSPYQCFKQADLVHGKAKMHEDCAIEVWFEDKKMLFCLTCRRQQIREIRRSEIEKEFHCHNSYFGTCCGNTYGSLKDRVRCNSPYPCKTKDGSKATMHRWCGILVDNFYFCQTCLLRPLKSSDDKRIFASDVFKLGSKRHPFTQHLIDNLGKVSQRAMHLTVQNGNGSDISGCSDSSGMLTCVIAVFMCRLVCSVCLLRKLLCAMLCVPSCLSPPWLTTTHTHTQGGGGTGTHRCKHTGGTHIRETRTHTHAIHDTHTHAHGSIHFANTQSTHNTIIRF